MAISQNPILPKCHSPKSLLLLHFSKNLSETFRINVNMDFAHTNRGKNSRAIFGFWAQNFFGDRMANLGLIDFIIGYQIYCKYKFEVHI